MIDSFRRFFYLNRCTRLKKENNELRQQSSSTRSNDQQQQIELLRQMVRAGEDALTKERAKTTTKKTNDYRALNDQVDLTFWFFFLRK